MSRGGNRQATFGDSEFLTVEKELFEIRVDRGISDNSCDA